MSCMCGEIRTSFIAWLALSVDPSQGEQSRCTTTTHHFNINKADYITQRVLKLPPDLAARKLIIQYFSDQLRIFFIFIPGVLRISIRVNVSPIEQPFNCYWWKIAVGWECFGGRLPTKADSLRTLIGFLELFDQNWGLREYFQGSLPANASLRDTPTDESSFIKFHLFSVMKSFNRSFEMEWLRNDVDGC